jgi:hypothetical protein
MEMVKEGDCTLYVYEDRTLKPVKIILSRWGDEGE